MNWLAQARRIALSVIVVATIALTVVGHDAPTVTCTFLFQIPTLISLTHVLESNATAASTGGVGGDRTDDGTIHHLLSTAGCSVTTSILLLEPGSRELPNHPDRLAPFAGFYGYVLSREQAVQPRVSGKISLESLEIMPHQDAVVLCTVTVN